MNTEDKIIQKLVEHDEKLSFLATKSEMDEKFDKVLTAVDGLAKKFDNFRAEMAANQAAHDRFEESIAELKSRMTQLERKI
jgi:uncharacterized coiled-coil DUF342 family protein